MCDRGDLDTDVLDGLASLVDRSLVRTAEEDQERFSMLETIREFAREKLKESGEADDIRRAHAESFGAPAEGAEPHLIGTDQKQWLDRLEREHDNLRAALRFALQHEACFRPSHRGIIAEVLVDLGPPERRAAVAPRGAQSLIPATRRHPRKGAVRVRVPGPGTG